MVLPSGEDPDSFVRRFGADAYLQRVAEAHPYLDFAVAQATEGTDMGLPASRARALKEVLPYLTIIPDRIERAASGDYVAGRLMIDAHLVQAEIQRERRAHHDPKPAQAGPPPALEKRVDLQREIMSAEKRFWEILLNRSDVSERVFTQVDGGDFTGAVTQPLFEAVADLTQRGEALTYVQLSDRLQNHEGLKDWLERCLVIDVEGDVDALMAEAMGCLMGLRRRRNLHQLHWLQAEIERAKDGRDTERENQLLAQKADVARALAQNLSPPDVGG